MRQVVKEARKQVRDSAAQDPQRYKTLLQALLVQALARLEEPAEGTASVRCRASDSDAVRAVLEPARQAYAQALGKEAPKLVLDAANPLPPAAAPGLEDDSPEGTTCAGGVAVATTGGKVVCSNTLDARVRIAYEALLPAIRAALFGDGDG
jgi:V-type H+-transporting ATPase subunit E